VVGAEGLYSCGAQHEKERYDKQKKGEGTNKKNLGRSESSLKTNLSNDRKEADTPGKNKARIPACKD